MGRYSVGEKIGCYGKSEWVKAFFPGFFKEKEVWF
jgi:hypothetical protein